VSERAARRLAWGLALLALAIYGGTIGVSLWGGTLDLLAPGLFGLTTLTFAGVGLLVSLRQRANPIGWLFLASAVLWGVDEFSLAYGNVALVERPGSLPAGLPMAWLRNWIWMPSIGLTAAVLLLFPTGRLPSPRWRPVLILAVASVAGATLTNAVAPAPLGEEFANIDTQVGLHGTLGSIAESATMAFFPLLMLSIIGSVAGLVVRFRRSRGDERQQIRLFVYTAAAAGIVILLGFLLYESLPGLIGLLVALALLAVPASAGVAILKYRLYDIDVVIRKAAVYTLLAAAVTGVYLLLVVAIPAALLHPTTTGQSLITIGVTVALTLALLPLRRRATRLANRLVYGKRATPYEVLSEFSARIGETYATEDALPRLARILTEGTGATRAEVWLRLGDELRLAASSAGEVEERPGVALAGSDDLPEIPEAGHVYPVRHAGELLGVLAVTKPPNDPLRPAEEQLLIDVAAQAGLVLRNVRLTEELKARLVDLQDSRKRLVAAQDEERRRLERNIHDGAQQQLVALAVKARLAESLAEKDPAKARDLIGQVREESQTALEDLRDLARGIYPPLLADQGLAAALEAQARKSPVPVTVDPDGVGRYPQEVEAAVYFCTLEALQNVAKYADASSAMVRLSATDGELRFEVVDDGVGFDPASTPRGSGLTNMSDRLEALSGSVEIRSVPGQGTTIAGRVPVRSPEVTS
jgi:signal transduction histidine kinase